MSLLLLMLHFHSICTKLIEVPEDFLSFTYKIVPMKWRWDFWTEVAEQWLNEKTSLWPPEEMCSSPNSRSSLELHRTPSILRDGSTYDEHILESPGEGHRRLGHSWGLYMCHLWIVMSATEDSRKQKNKEQKHKVQKNCSGEHTDRRERMWL